MRLLPEHVSLLLQLPLEQELKDTLRGELQNIGQNPVIYATIPVDTSNAIVEMIKAALEQYASSEKHEENLIFIQLFKDLLWVMVAERVSEDIEEILREYPYRYTNPSRGART